MSFDRDSLRTHLAQHGRVVRVVVADVDGSTPREVGASMLVWATGQTGTIGGGTLEFDATARAREMLNGRANQLDRLPLGPSLGQCCGGAVTLLSEIWDEARLAQSQGDIISRPLPGTSLNTPLALQRVLNASRAQGTRPEPGIVAGWMVEPITTPRRHLWIYGAGHVGRAFVDVLHPLPDLAITWVDTAADRFPGQIPENVTQLVASDPAQVARYAPSGAEHLILTYSHAIDLELCHALLDHGFSYAGLIGSKTKWARFKSRLRKLSHSDAQIARITCPIGDPSLGKHPQAIAISVASDMLERQQQTCAAKDAVL